MLKDDFRPRAPITQVPASWFNAVAKFVNGLVPGGGIDIARNGTDTMQTQVSLEPESAREILGVPSRLIGGEQEDFTDSPTMLDSAGTAGEWTFDGEKGLTLDCYCKFGPQADGSAYSVFQRCRLTFSTGGLLTKAELLADRIRVMARNL